MEMNLFLGLILVKVNVFAEHNAKQGTFITQTSEQNKDESDNLEHR